MKKVYTVDIQGFQAELPILPISDKLSIAFFNLHGNQELTEHCGKSLSKYLTDCDVVITAESKGLQLTHVVARELGMHYYAVVRKSKKLFFFLRFSLFAFFNFFSSYFFRSYIGLIK